MKKKPTPYPIIGAIAFGLLAIVGFYFYQIQVAKDSQEQIDRARDGYQKDSDEKIKELEAKLHTLQINLQNSGPTHRVLFATQDIDAGVQLTQDMFTGQDIATNVLKDAYTTDESNVVIKSFSLHSIRKNEPLTDGNVGLEAPHLSGTIPVGFKAMTVPGISGGSDLTGGFLVDGDYVDLMLLHPANPTDPKSSLACDAVIQNLRVVYVPGPGQHSNGMEAINPTTGPGQSPGITVEVTLKEAQILSLLQSIPQSHFGMILRSRGDNQTERDHPLLQDDIEENLPSIQPRIEKLEQKAKAQQFQQKQLEEKVAPQPLPEAPAPKL